MEHQEALTKLQAFSPTGNEDADVEALYALIDELGALKDDPAVRRDMIMIFERFPKADLGSPGPIVHALEKSPIDAHVELLAESIRRQATMMTVWMAQRCFRSKLSDQNRKLLLDALRDALAKISRSGELAMSIEETLSKYGN